MTLNRVVLIGYAGQKPELLYLNSGKILCKFPIIVESLDHNGKELLESIDLELWDKTAKVAEQYVPKGREIGIIGSLKFSSWKDRKTGILRQSQTILVNQLHLLGAFMKFDEEFYKSNNIVDNEDFDYYEYPEYLYETDYEPHDRYEDFGIVNDTDYGYLEDCHNISEYIY